MYFIKLMLLPWEEYQQWQQLCLDWHPFGEQQGSCLNPHLGFVSVALDDLSSSSRCYATLSEPLMFARRILIASSLIPSAQPKDGGGEGTSVSKGIKFESYE